MPSSQSSSHPAVPYPPVFRDWEHPDRRVATAGDITGVGVEMLISGPGVRPGFWKRVVLTEDDACLMAASLLQRAGRDKLAAKVLKALR